jgi:hypothetical protein
MCKRSTYLDILKSAFLPPTDQSPSPPDLDTLRESGIPAVSDTEFTKALNGLTNRRRTVRGLVESDS